MLKRLSRVEYQNSVNDVFGSQFSLLDNLPLDNIDEGFNNNADHLHISVVDMEAYFKVANLVASSVVGENRIRGWLSIPRKTPTLSQSQRRHQWLCSARSWRDTRLCYAATKKINPSVRTSGVYRVIPKGFYISRVCWVEKQRGYRR